MPLSAAESSDVAAQAAAPASETSDGRSNSGEEEDGNSMTEQVHITETIKSEIIIIVISRIIKI